MLNSWQIAREIASNVSRNSRSGIGFLIDTKKYNNKEELKAELARLVNSITEDTVTQLLEKLQPYLKKPED